MFCPKCGSNLPDDAAFCGSCGAQIPQKPSSSVGTAATPSTPEGGGKNKKVIIAIIAAIVIVIAVIVGAVNCFGGFKGSDTPQDLCKKVDHSLNQAAHDNYSEEAIDKLANELLDMMPPGFVDAYCTGKGVTKDSLKLRIKKRFTGLSFDGEYPFYRLSDELSSDRIDSINSQLIKIGYSKHVTNAFFIEMYVDSVKAHLNTEYRAVLVDGKWYLYDASLF